MKIKLKKSVELTTENNHQNLDLHDWQQLAGGKEIEVTKIPSVLVSLVETIEAPKEGTK
jgi:hypothetical protein